MSKYPESKEEKAFLDQLTPLVFDNLDRATNEKKLRTLLKLAIRRAEIQSRVRRPSFVRGRKAEYVAYLNWLAQEINTVSFLVTYWKPKRGKKK